MNKRLKKILPFPSVLKDLIEQRRLTLAEVAQMAGTSKSVVHGWINGSSPHDLFCVERLARRLGIPFYSLLFGEPEKVTQSKLDAHTDEELLAAGYFKIEVHKIQTK